MKNEILKEVKEEERIVTKEEFKIFFNCNNIILIKDYKNYMKQREKKRLEIHK